LIDARKKRAFICSHHAYQTEKVTPYRRHWPKARRRRGFETAEADCAAHIGATGTARRAGLGLFGPARAAKEVKPPGGQEPL